MANSTNNVLPDHVQANRTYWDEQADNWVEAGEKNWAATSPTWGIWSLPEAQLQLLPSDMTGLRTIELGCGTGYVSAWMARRGAVPTGIDNSARQLATAKDLMNRHRRNFDVMHGNAEAVPCADGSFDFAISEYGAAIWCDPELWIPEAHRLLVPGGRLVFLGNHPFSMLCVPANGAACDTQLHRPYFGMAKLDWRGVEIDPGGVEFNMPISQWLQLFERTGFVVERYQELQAPQQSKGLRYSVAAEWAVRWPAEQVWHLRKTVG